LNGEGVRAGEHVFGRFRRQGAEQQPHFHGALDKPSRTGGRQCGL
jgi:hypothetical protein